MSDLIDSDIESIEAELAELRADIEEKRAKLSLPVYDRELKVVLNSLEKQRADLERDLVQLRRERACELVHLTLSGPRTSDGTVQLRLLQRILVPFNDVLEYSSWRAHDVRRTADVPEDEFVRMLDLRLAGIDVGSADIQIVGNTSPDLTGSSALESGIRTTFGMLSSDSEEFAESVATAGHKAAASLRSLLSSLEKESISAALTWTSPSMERLQWSARPSEIASLALRLDQVEDPEVAEETVQGTVVLLASRGRLEIIDSRSESKISIKYASPLAEKVRELRLGDSRFFRVERTTLTWDEGRKRKDTYILRDVAVTSDLAQSGANSG